MATLRIRITHSDKEWKLIEKAACSGSRKLYKSGHGITRFLTVAISSALKTINIDSYPSKENSPVQKDFSITLSDDDLDKIKTLCQRLEITPGLLVSRLILQPKINNPSGHYMAPADVGAGTTDAFAASIGD